MNNKCSVCGRFVNRPLKVYDFKDGNLLCDSCWIKEEYDTQQQKILDQYQESTGFDSLDECTYCGIYQDASLWEHAPNCPYHKPQPKNKLPVDCTCGGQSFMDNPALHRQECPVFIYYYGKLINKPLNYQPQSTQQDIYDYNKIVTYTKEKEKELQEITKQKQIALEQFFKLDALNLKKKGDMGGFGFDWVNPIVNPIEPAKPKPEPKEIEIEIIEKPKKRKIEFD